VVQSLSWLASIALDAAARLSLPTALVLPDALLELCADGIEVLMLEEALLPPGPLGDPGAAFGVLGSDMAAYFDDYEFAHYLPGAWPLALDGGGGFFCLDLREVAAGRAPNDGSAPVIWSHAGNLGWADDEAAPMGGNLAAFLISTRARAI
jgi:hypothetical protein